MTASDDYPNLANRESEHISGSTAVQYTEALDEIDRLRKRGAPSRPMTAVAAGLKRCPWAIRYGNWATRCHRPAGHGTLHEAKGLKRHDVLKIVIEWPPGDLNEFRCNRDDEYAWEDET